jgi:transcription-repair coupling factor (superfamily II helicase)
MPEEVRQIFMIKRVKILARKVGIAQISETPEEIVLKFPKLSGADERTVQGLLEFIQSNPGVARIDPHHPDSIWLKKAKGIGDNPVKKIHYFLNTLLEYISSKNESA